MILQVCSKELAQRQLEHLQSINLASKKSSIMLHLLMSSSFFIFIRAAHDLIVSASRLPPWVLQDFMSHWKGQVSVPCPICRAMLHLSFLHRWADGMPSSLAGLKANFVSFHMFFENINKSPLRIFGKYNNNLKDSSWATIKRSNLFHLQ